MVSRGEQKVWETFLRLPHDLKESVEIPLVLRDLSPGKKKYRMRHVVAVVTRKPEEGMDVLCVRTVVGVLLPDIWGVRIVRELPIEMPGRPYKDFYASLMAAIK